MTCDVQHEITFVFLLRMSGINIQKTTVIIHFTNVINKSRFGEKRTNNDTLIAFRWNQRRFFIIPKNVWGCNSSRYLESSLMIQFKCNSCVSEVCHLSTWNVIQIRLSSQKRCFSSSCRFIESSSVGNVGRKNKSTKAILGLRCELSLRHLLDINTCSVCFGLKALQ